MSEDNSSNSKPKSDGWRFDKQKEVVYCGYYIKRKKRQCTHRVSANSDGFCSEHSPLGLAESRVSDMNARIRHECRSIMAEVTDKICAADDLNGGNNGSGSSPKQKKMRVSAPKRMANPFSIDLTPSISHVQPSEMFSQVHLPLHIDIGCAKGRCIERLSKRPERKNWNHLGVEIRGRTVEEAMQRVAEDRKLQYSGGDESEENKNLYFLTCNFAASVKELLDKFPRDSLRLISIQFPDPWKRKKHVRRLLVQKKLVKQLSLSLPIGAVVYISSDCDNVATWMVDRFLECEEDTNQSEQELTTTSDEKIHVQKNKRKCFRLLSTTSDLECITTPNMFISQSTSGMSVANENNPIIDDKEMETVEDDIDGDDSTELGASPSAETYSWFEANNNPLGELSERELVCEVDWRSVRRCCFVRV